MARRAADFDLVAAISNPGFTPSQRDVPELLGLLAEAPAETREHAERALRRVGAGAVPAAMERAKDAEPEAKARFVALVGRIAGAEGAGEVRAFLLGALADEAPGVRRRAAAGLGRALAASDEVETALAMAVAREADPAARAEMIEALGKLGGATAKQALTSGVAQDARTAKALRTALVRAARPAAREEGGRVDAERSLPARRTRVWLECRRGMLPVLLEEAAAFHPKIEHRLDGSAVAAIHVEGPLAALFAARTWTSLALPGEAVTIEAAGPPVREIARAITRGGARQAAAALTQGAVRYRLAWAGGGKRRASVYAVAEAVREIDPELVNDPTDAPWQIVVREAAERVAVEWAPALPDPRFAYRRGDVPAASHPTIAAALAFVAGAREGDVVWDPFVGSGLELCERALRGPYARLVGTDVDPAALDVARANLTACGAARFDLALHDAAKGAPPGLRPTLVVTNPPMGRRVHRSADLRSFLPLFVASVARSLAPSGRFAWLSPFPRDTRAAAESAGLAPQRFHVLDMGGFDAELQVFSR